MVTPAPLIKAAALAACLCALVAWAPRAVASDDFENLVAAEKAFAADVAAHGMRAGFLTALADDSVVFEPGPVSGKALWQSRPEVDGKFEWAPDVAEVAVGGDLAYTSGPWRFTPAGADKPGSFGHYLMIWRKDADGSWKVAIHQSVRHDEVPLPEKAARRGGLSAGAAPPWPVGVGELRKADMLPAGLLNTGLVSADFLRLRDNRIPDGRAEGVALAAPSFGRVDAGWMIASAGDLAVTWGGGNSSPSWLRIWRRPSAGDAPGLGWRLAVDISRAAPAPKE